MGIHGYEKATEREGGPHASELWWREVAVGSRERSKELYKEPLLLCFVQMPNLTGSLRLRDVLKRYLAMVTLVGG